MTRKYKCKAQYLRCLTKAVFVNLIAILLVSSCKNIVVNTIGNGILSSCFCFRTRQTPNNRIHWKGFEQIRAIVSIQWERMDWHPPDNSSIESILWISLWNSLPTVRLYLRQHFVQQLAKFPAPNRMMHSKLTVSFDRDADVILSFGQIHSECQLNFLVFPVLPLFPVQMMENTFSIH